jgi:hypothetical protein
VSRIDEALRTLAANRGCRLVKSRIRTPGRRDYGKYGLKDAASGAEVFGFSRHRLTATAEEIEQFLRASAAASWTDSVRGTKSGRGDGRR